MSDESAPKRLTHLIGNLGSEPKRREAKEGDVVGFSIAVTVVYGQKDVEDSGETVWVDISIFDEKQKTQAMGPETEDANGKPVRLGGELHKGSTIAVSGYLTSREYEEREFLQMIPHRISHIDWWERVPYAERQTASSPDAWVAPF